VGVQEAKDFLVQQTAEQAQLEGVPFSDLERRMMYFTEIEEMPEDPIQLNEEFEANTIRTNMRPRFPSSYIMLTHETRRRIPKQHANGTKQSKFLTRETIIYRCSGVRIPL
jgi:hypothetical protein